MIDASLIHANATNLDTVHLLTLKLILKLNDKKMGATQMPYKEFGLTLDEIIDAINEGKLQFIETSIYGNPFMRLLRYEVEALVAEKYSEEYLNQKKAQNELAQVKKELKELKTKMKSLEQRKTELLAVLEERK